MKFSEARLSPAKPNNKRSNSSGHISRLFYVKCSEVILSTVQAIVFPKTTVVV